LYLKDKIISLKHIVKAKILPDSTKEIHKVMGRQINMHSYYQNQFNALQAAESASTLSRRPNTLYK
jgi:hypothetical protein